MVWFVATDIYGAAMTNETAVTVPADANGNGLPDGWEWQQTGSLTNPADAVIGPSGFTLLEHYIAGTTPASSTDYFHAVGISGAPALISVPTVSGRLYRIWFSDDSLSPAPVWHLFGNQANGIGSWLETNPPTARRTFIDDYTPATSGTTPTNGTRFYRLDVQLPP